MVCLEWLTIGRLAFLVSDPVAPGGKPIEFSTVFPGLAVPVVPELGKNSSRVKIRALGLCPFPPLIRQQSSGRQARSARISLSLAIGYWLLAIGRVRFGFLAETRWVIFGFGLGMLSFGSALSRGHSVIACPPQRTQRAPHPLPLSLLWFWLQQALWPHLERMASLGCSTHPEDGHKRRAQAGLNAPCLSNSRLCGVCSNSR
jgi:hypothetical protein